MKLAPNLSQVDLAANSARKFLRVFPVLLALVLGIRGAKLQVFDGIVERISVLMVDALSRLELSANMLFHDYAIGVFGFSIHGDSVSDRHAQKDTTNITVKTWQKYLS